MAVHNCPLGELGFASRNECEWHVRNEHSHLDRYSQPAVGDAPAPDPKHPGPDPSGLDVEITLIDSARSLRDDGVRRVLGLIHGTGGGVMVAMRMERAGLGGGRPW
jgi:hypothetical protein